MIAALKVFPVELSPVHQEVLDIVTRHPGARPLHIFERARLCVDEIHTVKILHQLAQAGHLIRSDGSYSAPSSNQATDLSTTTPADPPEEQQEQPPMSKKIPDRILAVLIKPMPPSEIAAAAGIDQKAAGNACLRMRKAGLIVDTGEKAARGQKIYARADSVTAAAPTSTPTAASAPKQRKQRVKKDKEFKFKKQNGRAAPVANTANDDQIAGSHYKNRPIQPWDFIAANGLSWFQGEAIKYITRYREKNGVEDLRKARHVIDKLIEVEEAASA